MRARSVLPVLPVLGLVLAMAAVTPAADAAAVRYAIPGGSGTACTAAVPCNLSQALNSAASGGGTAFDLNFAGSGVISTMKVRNLTAIATGGGTAFDIFSSGSGSHMTMDVKNSILSGAIDVRTTAAGGAQTTVTLATS